MPLSNNDLTAKIQRLTTTLDAVGAYIYTKDIQSYYTYANQMVCDLFNSSLNDIVGQSDKAFFDLSTFNELQENDRRVINNNEHLEFEETNIIKDNSRKTNLFLCENTLTQFRK